jgi:type IV secretory pathway TraG/TraD family ATPase VirD4
MFFEPTLKFTLIGGCVLCGVIVFTAFRAWILRRPQLSVRHLRGRRLRDAETVRANLHRSPGTIRLGGCLLPHRVAYGHFAAIGATGSGKTILQRLLMQSVLPRIGSGLGQRALVYDAKQEVLSLLGGMDISAHIHVLNPLDSRCVAWDIAADVTSPASVLQAASLLIPKAAHDANPFFSNAARHLLHGIFLALVLKAPKRWTLRQAILILRSESLLRQVLEENEPTRYLLQYCEHPATFQNILSTILTRIAPYEIIAALWDQAESRLSLRSWLDSESILVLGNAEDNRAAIDTINQLIFKRLSELILAKSEIEHDSSRTTWLLLDEVRQAGPLEGLSALMTKGRSKGAAVLLGFQDINGLRDVYGKEVADELVGQCNTKAILRLNSPETARWASQLIGSSEFIETRKSRSRSRSFRDMGLREGGSSGVSFSDGITNRALVLDSELLDLPETSLENGLTGIFVSPLTGAFRDHLTGSWLADHLKLPNPHVANFVPRPESHQYLRPWSDADALELGLVSARPIPLRHRLAS